MIGIVTLTITPMIADFRIVRRTRGYEYNSILKSWTSFITYIIYITAKKIEGDEILIFCYAF